MRADRLKVLVLSRYQSEEMVPAIELLERLFVGADVLRASTVGAVDRLVNRSGWRADLVVAGLHWPDEYGKSEVRALLSWFPLARWVCLAGLWCESLGRTGSCWPHSMLVPARAAETRLRRERDVLSGRAAPLPWTASREETFAFDHAQQARRPARATDMQGIQIVTPDRQLGRMLSDLLTDAGYSVRCGREAETEPRAVIWDVDPWRPETPTRLRSVSTEHPSSAVVALAAMAPPGDSATLSKCGVEGIVTKLAAPTLLVPTLDDLLGGSRPFSENMPAS